ncbi:MAG: phosphatase PAP2 family protein [Bacteriovoracaceae bacterium]
MNLILLILIILSPNLFAEDRLKFVDIFKEIPTTSKSSLKKSFSKESISPWSAILASTAVLYIYDEEIYKEMQKKGRDWRIGNEDNTKPVVTGFGQELVRLPTDIGSALYFLGDGWTHVGIASGFLATGYLKDQTHEVNTGYMLMHGMIVSTIFNQALKRSFGRESPNVSTHQRGSWRLFPSFNEYNSKTGSYDAMPSGHVMTATMTFTVLGERYPEFKLPIYALGSAWVSALAFEMMNNGVHWASDYPLGIGMGILFGKMAVQMGKKENQVKTSSEEREMNWIVVPSFYAGTTGLRAMASF